MKETPLPTDISTGFLTNANVGAWQKRLLDHLGNSSDADLFLHGQDYALTTITTRNMSQLLAVPDRSYFQLKVLTTDPSLQQDDTKLNLAIDKEISATQAKIQETFLEPQSLLSWNQKSMKIRQDLRDKDYTLLKALKDSVHPAHQSTYATTTTCNEFYKLAIQTAKNGNTITFRQKLQKAFNDATKTNNETIASFDSRLTNLQSDLNFYGIETTNRTKFLQLIAGLQNAQGYDKIIQEFDILPDDFDIDKAMNQIRNLEVRLGYKEQAQVSSATNGQVTVNHTSTDVNNSTLSWCNTHGYGHLTSECRNPGEPTEKAKWELKNGPWIRKNAKSPAPWNRHKPTSEPTTATSKEYAAFKNYLANKESTANNVTIPLEQVDSYNEWKTAQKANKGHQNYFPIDYAHDSACTPYHMSRELPSNYEAFPQPLKINLATAGSSTEALGKGNITLKNHNGETLLLKEVLYIPSLSRALISGPALKRDGYTQMIDTDVTIVCKETGNIFTIPWNESTQLWQTNVVDNGISVSATNTIKPTPTTTTTKSKPASNAATNLWHKRLGYPNLETMRAMISNNLVLNFPLKSIHGKVCKCNGCMLGKAHKLPWSNDPKEYKKIYKPGEYLLADLYGPTRIATPGGRKRSVTYTDLVTDYTFTYVIKKKSEQENIFRQLESQLERQMGIKVKHIHFDRGGEFLSNELTDYLVSKGIQYSMSAARTPEQNAIPERKNRTLMDKTLAALHDSKTPLRYWGDFLLATTKLHNLTPHLKNNTWVTPFEQFLGYKPDVQYLRRLGSLCWEVLDVDQRRQQPTGKLSPKSEQCILIGYSTHSSSYRVASIRTGKITEPRNVIFDESRTIKDIRPDKYDIIMEPLNESLDVLQTQFESHEDVIIQPVTETIQPVTTSNRFAAIYEDSDSDDESDDENVESTPEPQQNPTIIPELYLQTSSDSDISEPNDQPTQYNDDPQTENRIQSSDLIPNNSIPEPDVQSTTDHDVPRIDTSTQSNIPNFPLALRLEDLNFDTSSEDESYQPSSPETSSLETDIDNTSDSETSSLETDADHPSDSETSSIDPLVAATETRASLPFQIKEAVLPDLGVPAKARQQPVITDIKLDPTLTLLGNTNIDDVDINSAEDIDLPDP